MGAKMGASEGKGSEAAGAGSSFSVERGEALADRSPGAAILG